jgi:selenocysteine-specific elongation factor
VYVVGTAGHVDHGKSTLVEALTGINPDRLKEERERQMTIDLGFAWLTLPGGVSVGVVDVPGHRDFIENMLAGVGGIDAALLVIAADEGVMPQTREHFAILNLLHITAGVVALTKCDLVEADWLDLMRADVAGLLLGTGLEAAPHVPVSARTGQGLEALRAALAGVLADRPARPDLGRPHLPIDRVFSMPGFGPVVTGTLSGGSLRVGDEVAVEPGGLTARVRGLQTHKTKLDRALPGSRVAVNLAGVDAGDLRRGQVVARPGTARPTTLLDVRLEHLAGASQALKHNEEVKLFVGAAEVVARARLLEADHLPPGGSGWAQLVLRSPVVAVKGERFILRRPSPAETIGGGTVVDPHPPRAHRRSQVSVLARLETLARGTPAERLLQALDSLGPAAGEEASRQAGLEPATGAAAVEELLGAGLAVRLEGGALLVSAAALNAFMEALAETLAAFHQAQPLRGGMPREEVRSRLGAQLPAARRARWTARVFNALLAEAIAAEVAAAAGPTVRLSGHQIVFAPATKARVDALLAEFRRDPHNPPSHKECAAQVGDDVLAALIEQGALVALTADVVFLAETYAALVAGVRAHLAAHGSLTVAEARDLFGSSRKYMLALLEHLDAAGVTRREGDARVARQTL